MSFWPAGAICAGNKEKIRIMDTTTGTATVQERVARGMALLDEMAAGWWQPGNIDLKKLDLAGPCKCVLGQLFIDRHGNDDWSWYSIISEYGLDPQLNPASRVTRVTDWDCGFNADIAPGVTTMALHREYEALTAEWKRVILARREAS
jgi:hypothetical protein